MAFSGLSAQALQRALLFEAQRSIAADLQRALLPAVLPALRGARHAVRYLPWTHGADVGGDWYDVIPLGPDAVAVVIGDVAGHSPNAAAIMGQIRNALRAYAAEGHSPTGVMDRVNRLMLRVEPDSVASCCYLEVHLAEGTATARASPGIRHRCCTPTASRRPLSLRTRAAARRRDRRPGTSTRASCCPPAARWCSTPTAWSRTSATTSTGASPTCARRWRGAPSLDPDAVRRAHPGRRRRAVPAQRRRRDPRADARRRPAAPASAAGERAAPVRRRRGQRAGRPAVRGRHPRRVGRDRPDRQRAAPARRGDHQRRPAHRRRPPHPSLSVPT